MKNYINDKINIGISSCAYGCHVRYNHKGWDLVDNLGREKSNFIFHPVCPECMAGLGVPRDPIKVVGLSGDDVWSEKAKIKNASGKDVTKSLKEASLACLETLKRANVKVYIYMEGSPSCGVYRTTLKNKRLGKPPGVFGSLLLKEEIFLIPAKDLESPIKRWDWRRRMFAFVWASDIEIKSKTDLFEFWHKMKFLCQEIDEKRSRQLGHEIALKEKGFNLDDANFLRKEVLQILRTPSTLEKIKNRLWKHYTYLRKKHDFEIENVMDPNGLRNVTHLANELLEIERKAVEIGDLFAASPILYKKKDR